jgi:hypothetical protein
VGPTCSLENQNLQDFALLKPRCTVHSRGNPWASFLTETGHRLNMLKQIQTSYDSRRPAKLGGQYGLVDILLDSGNLSHGLMNGTWTSQSDRSNLKLQYNIGGVYKDPQWWNPNSDTTPIKMGVPSWGVPFFIPWTDNEDFDSPQAFWQYHSPI